VDDAVEIDCYGHDLGFAIWICDSRFGLAIVERR
jgi:hypothetical protein